MAWQAEALKVRVGWVVRKVNGEDVEGKDKVHHNDET
jgi:hypothetical protein